jgi:hypothetical protein
MSKPIPNALLDDPYVRKVTDQGYTIEYADTTDGMWITFTVTKARNYAGHAEVFLDHQRGAFHFTAVNVPKEHRRKGIANAIYRCAIFITQLQIERATGQMEDGRALWDQPNRPW